ncbi:ABC transporter permease [Streptosporangium sp. NPDC002721]|uniref:ABC transporter permease n=1 Tax=Streptosporangium sp. NPDC002721 TaxID=3366188 RepID=UPI0036CAB3B2
MIIILLKDLRQRAKDSTLIVFAIVLPLGMAFILNAVLGGTGGDFKARYAVADADRGAAGGGFVRQVLEPMRDSGVVTLRTVATAEEGRALTQRGEVEATFVIPAGFSADVRAGRPATLEIVGSVAAPVAVQVAREVGQAYVTGLRSVQLAVAVVSPSGTAPDPERAAGLAERAGALPVPLSVREDTSAVRRQLDTTTYYAAGMAMFFLFFAVVFSITSIFDERRAGTLTRMLAAPVSRPAIVLGKLLSGILVGVVSMTILVVVTTLVLGARWGDPLGVAALVVSGVLAATGLMAALATFARTAEQASNWQSVVAMVLGIFGGVFFPTAQLGALTTLGYLTPHKWFMQGLADLAGGGSLPAVAVPVAALLGFAALGGALALFRVGRMVHA